MVKGLLGLIIVAFIIIFLAIKLLKHRIKLLVKKYGWEYISIKYPNEDRKIFLDTIENGKWVYNLYHARVTVYNKDTQNNYEFDLITLSKLSKYY
jgi:hypothetical protein